MRKPNQAYIVLNAISKPLAKEVPMIKLVLSDIDGTLLPFGTPRVSARTISAIEELRDAAPFVRIVGDAVRPANITTAVYEAFHAALDI